MLKNLLNLKLKVKHEISKQLNQNDKHVTMSIFTLNIIRFNKIGHKIKKRKRKKKKKK